MLLSINRAPTAWGHAALDIQNEFIHQLENQYPWIWLCDGHWKAMKVATNSYPHWYAHAFKRKLTETVKREAGKSKAAVAVPPIDVDIDDNEGGSSKRPQTEDDNMRAPKHPCIEDPQPIPRPTPTRKDKQHQKVCGYGTTGSRYC
jgi:hypothetical protein